ncbi:MAG: ribonuclease P protein component [Candidatus Eisenbacteria bacterium]|uniref:Ribonuclease P protein component n=1 Tax=Eiseniibacteriota bacterium TaxID=2212470 RepID=A0A937X9L0_UNCEI|nr:ribonuclease P protein component [Candidatus Eisenbacteria bacterium]
MPWGDEALSSTQAIRRLFAEGAVHHGRLVLLIRRQVDEGPRRVLFVASRKTGHAVRRNRAKRLMRAAYQRVAPCLAERPVHLAWVARSACAAMKMEDVRRDMEGLLTRAGLWSPAQPAPAGERSPAEGA